MALDFKITNGELMNVVQVALFSIGLWFAVIAPLRDFLPTLAPNTDTMVIGAVVLIISLFIFKRK